MHYKVEEAFEQIDAAVFNGDDFDDPESKKTLVDFINRWARYLKEDVQLPEVKVPTDEALKLANRYIEGHDRPKDEYCPECWLCNQYMEYGEGEPAAFCSSCVYQVADILAPALLAIAKERDNAEEKLLFMRDEWSIFGARPCPACLYENGRFIRSCKLHEYSDAAEAARALLREQLDAATRGTSL